MMNNTNTERRTHPRYSAPHLSLSLVSTTSNTLDNISYETNSVLTVLDFNHSGMAVQSRYNFKVGDVLNIIISDNISKTDELVCFVCNRAKTDLGYRCGLHFLLHDENNKVSKESLLAMEKQLDTMLS